jgi:hypothetical protein
MITEQTLENLDQAIKQLNNFWFSNTGLLLDDDKDKEISDSIKRLLEVQQQIMLHLHKD